MPSISPLIVRVFDSPHAIGRHNRRANRTRFESRGRVAKRRSR
jgi:hypothetical protein